MYFIVTLKSTVLQPNGQTSMILKPNIFDLIPKYDTTEENLIVDFEWMDDPREELLDRSTFATIKQRGADPVSPNDGIQWAESLVGEVQAPAIMGQLLSAVQQEGPLVKIAFGTAKATDGTEYFQYNLALTNAT